jgi:hypothetical protein
MIVTSFASMYKVKSAGCQKHASLLNFITHIIYFRLQKVPQSEKLLDRENKKWKRQPYLNNSRDSERQRQRQRGRERKKDRQTVTKSDKERQRATKSDKERQRATKSNKEQQRVTKSDKVR